MGMTTKTIPPNPARRMRIKQRLQLMWLFPLAAPDEARPISASICGRASLLISDSG
jgi:hypothetical protein